MYERGPRRVLQGKADFFIRLHLKPHNEKDYQGYLWENRSVNVFRRVVKTLSDERTPLYY